MQRCFLGAALIKSLEYLLAKANCSDAMNKQQPFIVDSTGQWFTEIALCLFNYHHHVAFVSGFIHLGTTHLYKSVEVLSSVLINKSHRSDTIKWNMGAMDNYTASSPYIWY